MATDERLSSHRKPSIRLKMSSDMDAWFSTPQHRVRSPADNTLPPAKESFTDTQRNNATGLVSWRQPGCTLARLVLQPQAYLALRHPRLYWVLAFYCCFSVLFFTSGLVSVFSPSTSQEPQSPVSRSQQLSQLQHLSADHLISKLTSLQPSPVALYPYVSKAHVDTASVTACLWTDDQNVGVLPVWASRWKGPISVLVTTTVAPNSSDSQALVHKISALSGVSSIKYKLSAHVLHLAGGSTPNPNAFLNLARVLAQTPTVVLFPGDLSVAPPKTFQRMISSSADSRKPVVFNTRGRAAFPFSALSPVLLERDSPAWCTERFFPALSRSADWTECLWQLWLENFGAVEVRQTTDWVNEMRTAYNTSSVETKIHKRLSAKFRAETCVLATRQAAATHTSQHDADTRKLRWLKRNCRVSIAGKDRD